MRILLLGPVPADGLPPASTSLRRAWAEPFPADGRGFDEVRCEGLPGHVAACDLQRLLRPGGRLTVRLRGRRVARRTARHLGHYFEGGSPRQGERFRPVEAVRDGAAWRIQCHRRGPGLVAGHFDNLAPEYGAEIPRHLVEAYLERKLTRIVGHLQGRPGSRILDLGCGVGAYARAVAAASGAAVVAVDASQPSVRLAARNDPGRQAAYAAASGTALPFADGAFDLAYTINMLHHLKRGEQEDALREVRRVLRPDGTLLVFEINLRNPLFRFYMRRIFPRTRRIDRGDEEFIRDSDLPLGTPFRVDRVEHYTFLPDFLPRGLLKAGRTLERALERGPLRRLGIHYTAVLRPAGAQP
jgi:ubiquinone/menaquinone biosynthesis C-methylase UbiE